MRGDFGGARSLYEKFLQRARGRDLDGLKLEQWKNEDLVQDSDP